MNIDVSGRLRVAAFAIGVSVALAACGAKTPETPPPAEPEKLTLAAPDAGLAPEPELVVSQLLLFRLDCGTIEISDLNDFADDGSYAGVTDTFTNTCWLVRHPAGDLLWDTGLPGILAGQGEQTQGVYTISMDRTITSQLRDIGMNTGEVEYVAISHSHFDHTGQIDQVPGASWIAHEAEVAAMFGSSDDEAQFVAFEGLKRETFTGERDVFGDGSVRIIEAPGHTPGHSVLFVNLPETGPLLLVGDLWHRTESREGGKIPRFNWDVLTPPAGVEPGAISRASLAKIEEIAAQTGARIIIQHEPDSVGSLPAFPEMIR
jgi:glyoxylase-like metal-dependent hydrolase (beta-lactamase superfamily II)